MIGMARCVDGYKAQATDDDLFRILRDLELILFNRQELTPKLIHPISINAGGAGNEFFRVQHMRRAIRVDVYLRTLLRKPACSPCMVKMNVCEQNVGYVSGS